MSRLSIIEDILTELKFLWIKNSELRLGQLLFNTLSSRPISLFYFDDEALLNLLKDLNKPSGDSTNQ